MQKATNVAPSSTNSAASSTSSNSSSRKSKAPEKDESGKYLPAVLANRKAARVGLIALDYKKCADGRYKYVYTVNWKEDIKEAAAKAAKDADFMEMLKLDRLEQLSRQSQAPHPIVDAIKKPPASSGYACRRCDGPCGRRLPVDQLKSMGLCEHNICLQCLETAPQVEPRFGGLGCPNRKCYLLDVAVLCPDKKKRMEVIQQAYALKSPATSISQATLPMKAHDQNPDAPIKRSFREQFFM